jgi:hypothetical protein
MPAERCDPVGQQPGANQTRFCREGRFLDLRVPSPANGSSLFCRRSPLSEELAFKGGVTSG